MNQYPNYILMRMAKERNQEARRIVKANRMCKASRSGAKKVSSKQGAGEGKLFQALVGLLLGRSARAAG